MSDQPADMIVLHAPVTMADVVLPKPADGVAPPSHPYKPLPTEMPPIGDVTTARAIQTAERLIANGVPRERVVAALESDGYDADLLNNLSREELANDRAHGVQQYIDPASYNFPLGNVQGVANVTALNNDVRELAASMGLPGARGYAFCQLVVASVAGATQHRDLAAVEAQTARNDAIIRNVFGAKYEAAAALVNELLNEAAKEHSNPKLIAQLRPGGHACSPAMFGRLHSHALAMKAWAASAPKK